MIRTSGELDTFSNDDLTRGFLVVPHDVPTDLTLLPEGAGKLCLVTNWWVERCLHSKTLVNPTDNVLCRPFDKQSISGTYSPEVTRAVDTFADFSGFDGLTVNSTAFVGIELLHVTKAIALMGTLLELFPI